MADLRRVPTAELKAELVRRANGQWRERESTPIPLCDECAHFEPYTIGEDIPADFNPCAKGHKMRFRVPQTMGDVHAGNWGFYRRGCPDRVRPPSTVESR